MGRLSDRKKCQTLRPRFDTQNAMFSEIVTVLSLNFWTLPWTSLIYNEHVYKAHLFIEVSRLAAIF